MKYVYRLVRLLPDGTAKTSETRFDRKVQAAKAAARSHADNTGADRVRMDEIYDALMGVLARETVGPFGGYRYRIETERKR